MRYTKKECKNLSININKLEFEINLVTNNIFMHANKIYDIGSNTLLESIFSNYQYIYYHLYNEKLPKTLEQKYWINLKDTKTFQESINLRKDVRL